MPQKTKKCGQKNTVTAIELEKNVTSYEIFRKKILVRTNTAHGGRSSKKTLGHSRRKSKSNDLEPHFPTSATKSRSLEDTKTAVALPHCSESTQESIAGWWTLGLKVRLELSRNYGTSSYNKKTDVEVLPFVDLSAEAAFCFVFCGRCNTGVIGLRHLTWCTHSIRRVSTRYLIPGIEQRYTVYCTYSVRK